MKKNPFINLAYFERESDLRRKWGRGAKKITPLQSTWTRCMLANWGAKYRGDDYPTSGNINILGRLMIRKEWDSEQGARIQIIFNNLTLQGYSGIELVKKVKEIFLPNNSGSASISLAKEQDDAEFVEKVMAATLTPDNPIRAVVIKHYKERKSSQDISVELCKLTGIELENARTRIRWASNLSEAVIFNQMLEEMEKENLSLAA